MDWFLSFLTCLSLYFTGNKSIWGPILGTIGQIPWLLYVLFVIHQPGLLVGVFAYGILSGRAWYKWHKDSKTMVG